MRFALRTYLAITLLAALAFAAPLGAQTGTLSGRLTDVETAEPLAEATVEVLGTGLSPIMTNALGEFRVALPAGTYSVLVRVLGYRMGRFDGIRIEAGATEEISISLSSFEVLLNPVVVSASRRQEKALDAPAAISTVDAETIMERAAPTTVEHVKALPGIDVVQSGLTQANVVARGFNNVFSGALLVLTDNRYVHIPSLRLNAYHMIPITDLDLDRIEVSLGPGAALYGPNSANGVMHLLTKSPIDNPGTMVSVAGGERSVFHAALRHASSFNNRLGFKISGQYFRGNDWEFVDPLEQAAKAANPGNLRIGNRNFDTERWTGDARIDYRFPNGAELIASAGLNHLAGAVELTGAGAGQIEDWRYQYLQTRYTNGRFFSQFFINTSDAGSSFLLSAGEDLVDLSRMLAFQVQHGVDIGQVQSFIYGVDVQRSIPRTEGTITGRNEGDDNIDEIGGYLHSQTRVSDLVDLVGAVRVDYHNRLEDPNFSPRAAVVVHPNENQTLRLTFNRAFGTPTTNNLFLDLLAAQIPIGTFTSYDLRILGVPEGGFTFPTCTGGFMNLCMRLPTVPGEFPADATLAWDALIQALAPTLAPFLPNPGAAVQTVLRRFSQIAKTFSLDPGGPVPIDPIRSTITNTLEAGYKGVLGNRVLLSANVYYSKVKDFVGPLRVETPSVFLDPGSTATYVQTQLAPLISAGFVTQAQADALIAGLAQIPIGTVAPTENPQADLLLTYRNFGDIDFWGADFGAEVLLTDEFSVTGSVALVSKECFDGNADGTVDCAGIDDVALNAPNFKGTLGARYDNRRFGLSVEARLRYTDGFPMNSGVYVGDVESYAVLDANVGYRLRALPGAMISITGTNVTNNLHREFIGAPELGRLILGRVQYAF